MTSAAKSELATSSHSGHCYFYATFLLQVNNACSTGSSALYLGKQLIEGGKQAN